jgi:hypothetical protein
MDDFVAALLCLPFIVLPAMVLGAIILGKIRASEIVKDTGVVLKKWVRRWNQSRVRPVQGPASSCPRLEIAEASRFK